MSDWEEAHKQMNEAKELAQRLVDLLDDPHPGLMSWSASYHGTLRKLNDLSGTTEQSMGES